MVGIHNIHLFFDAMVRIICFKSLKVTPLKVMWIWKMSTIVISSHDLIMIKGQVLQKWKLGRASHAGRKYQAIVCFSNYCIHSKFRILVGGGITLLTSRGLQSNFSSCIHFIKTVVLPLVYSLVTRRVILVFVPFLQLNFQSLNIFHPSFRH